MSAFGGKADIFVFYRRSRCANADRFGGGSPNIFSRSVRVSNSFCRSTSKMRNLISSGDARRGFDLGQGVLLPMSAWRYAYFSFVDSVVTITDKNGNPLRDEQWENIHLHARARRYAGRCRECSRAAFQRVSIGSARQDAVE